MLTADIVIVGAGVIGAAIAYALACAGGLRVVLVERGTPGCAASNAAAGVLAVASGQARRGFLFDLRCASAALFPDLIAALQEETGIDVGYRRNGVIALALSAAEAAALAELVQHRRTQGLPCEMLDRAAVLAAEPAITPHVCAGALFRDDATVDNEGFVTALVTAARRRGVSLLTHKTVRSLSSDKGVVRLVTDDGVLEAGVAVIAAGAWSNELLAGCGLKVPLRPARGEMAAVRPPDWELHHVVSCGDGYLVPRGAERVLIGSTLTFAGFDARVTEAGLAALLVRAEAMVPAIRQAPLLRTWAGLRPCSTIRRPIIAPLPALDHVLLATGHHRNGILLAPITGKLVTEMITGAAPSVPMAPLSYRRH